MRERSVSADLRSEPERAATQLTEHVEADFLGLLARLVPGQAGVVALVHLPHVPDQQLGAVLVQAVLVPRVQDHVVAAAEEETGNRTGNPRLIWDQLLRLQRL